MIYLYIDHILHIMCIIYTKDTCLTESTSESISSKFCFLIPSPSILFCLQSQNPHRVNLPDLSIPLIQLKSKLSGIKHKVQLLA